jgi:hypothetical protein
MTEPLRMKRLESKEPQLIVSDTKLTARRIVSLSVFLPGRDRKTHTSQLLVDLNVSLFVFWPSGGCLGFGLLALASLRDTYRFSLKKKKRKYHKLS